MHKKLNQSTERADECCFLINSLISIYHICLFFFRVPTEDPTGESVILPRHEFMRIVQHSRVISKEERQAMEEQAKREKEMAMVSWIKLHLYYVYSECYHRKLILSVNAIALDRNGVPINPSLAEHDIPCPSKQCRSRSVGF